MFNFFKSDTNILSYEELDKISTDELLSMLGKDGNISRQTGSRSITIVAQRLHERLKLIEDKLK